MGLEYDIHLILYLKKTCWEYWTCKGEIYLTVYYTLKYEKCYIRQLLYNLPHVSLHNTENEMMIMIWITIDDILLILSLSTASCQCKPECSSLDSPQAWRERQHTPLKDDALNGKSSNGFRVKPLEQHMANLTFLESK